MGAGHSHGSGHAHGGATGAQNRKRLTIVLVLAATYMVAEVIGGLLTNSLALLADAGHMLSDVASLALSLFALWVARRPATTQHTFGYYRTEILAALVNGARWSRSRSTSSTRRSTASMSRPKCRVPS